MKSFTIFLAAIIVLASVEHSTAYAKSNKGHCPPGLAKKNPPCVPPGQAKKPYQSGEDYYYGNDYLSDRDRRRYKLPRLPYGESYYRVGDSFIRVNNKTREVPELFEAIGRVLN